MTPPLADGKNPTNKESGTNETELGRINASASKGRPAQEVSSGQNGEALGLIHSCKPWISARLLIK